ncbi:hypothetical protein H1P_4950006 [Hyella patelloides LEGE 07179]|uniref:Uncharacterized protein n=1 Tax=Hyella patelloides LEGE 07179 TaxID=945734 RepID=A0A563VZ95_9CYAN|nr:hypothetical protein H1P_4950006 [Hyella patelloides LEGE 07179]
MMLNMLIYSNLTTYCRCYAHLNEFQDITFECPFFKINPLSN